MVDIAWGMRMIGWVHEPHGCMPPHPPPSRRTFLLNASVKFVMNAAADLTFSVLGHHFLRDPADDPEAYLNTVPVLRRMPYILSWAIGVATSTGARHNAIALLCIGLGHSSPTLWPDIWGSWADAYTVRKLWGYAHSWRLLLSTSSNQACFRRTWHQQFPPVQPLISFPLTSVPYGFCVTRHSLG